MFAKLKMNYMKPVISSRLNSTLKSLREFGMFNKSTKCLMITEDACNEPSLDYAYVHESDKGMVYDIFYGNMHIHILKGDAYEVYSIRIKKKDEAWNFGMIDDNIDYSHPVNYTYEVFISYDVPVLDNVARANGIIYKNGKWDEYVHENLTALFNTVYCQTDESQFNESYS